MISIKKIVLSLFIIGLVTFSLANADDSNSTSEAKAFLVHVNDIESSQSAEILTTERGASFPNRNSVSKGPRLPNICLINPKLPGCLVQ